MKTSQLCKLLIRKHVQKGLSSITSWHEFEESRELGFIDYNVKHSTLLRAMSYGKERGWLNARWGEVGLTPYAGSATRERHYEITEKGKREALRVKVYLTYMAEITPQMPISKHEATKLAVKELHDKLRKGETAWNKDNLRRTFDRIEVVD